MKQLIQLLAVLGICMSSKAQTTEKSLLWEVSGNGLNKKSYIYGTMHVGDKRVYDFKKSMTKAFKKSDILALELNMDSVNQMSVMSKLLMDGDANLKNLLSEDDYTKVETFFKDSLGMPLSMYDKMQPIFTSSIIGTKDIGTENEDALDLYLFKEAKKMNKPVHGLEVIEEQVGAFNAIPYDAQARSLLKSIQAAYGENVDSSSPDMEEMMKYYLEGDLEKMVSFTQLVDSDDPEISKLFEETFIIKRNHNMADRAVPLMKEGSVFIAVGAAHLGGKEGVIQLLRNKGYTVKAK